tara:strand:+ start:977 stop:1210 length:234 start_codon:yes stop_codon:yes gene_type:complete
MGKMKEIYMEMLEQEYQGDHDTMIADMARQSCEEFIKDENHMCPNCMNPALERNETEARCISCAQEYVFVNSSLRFK